MKSLVTHFLYILTTSLIIFSYTAQADTTEKLAPDFTLKSNQGANMRLSEQRGNVVLINFWASWCGPCREELPKMEKIQQDYQDLGFTILAINVDEDSNKADILLDDIKVTYPILFDPSSSVSQLYDVSAMPTTVIIDRNGKQRFLHMGYKSGDEKKYAKMVKALIRE
ncbi:TlpA disulfide reductase family protein [Paraglaciecola sp. L3A3]|uniref:TlpA disulfide reductase family protein n=1 Tax=Paraglaciecola sp. L3A3 TaxID=2686358 RepID=UPI00131BAB9E|nr:TlpA disulfide reductase family protein [Paraglaciecola sp. L3A3]